MRYEFNPENVTTTFETFDKGTYECILNEPKTYFREGKNGKNDRGGVQFNMTIAEGEHKNKPLVFAPNFGDSFGPSQGKAVVMAALGYDPYDKESEKKFNADSSNWDWTLDTDAKILGEAWHKVKGMRVKVDLDINEAIAQDGSMTVTKFQQFKKFLAA